MRYQRLYLEIGFISEDFRIGGSNHVGFGDGIEKIGYGSVHFEIEKIADKGGHKDHQCIANDIFERFHLFFDEFHLGEFDETKEKGDKEGNHNDFFHSNTKSWNIYTVV